MKAVKVYKITMISGIYSIRNLINDKLYIGSAVDTSKRWNRHLNDLNKNKHCNSYLQKAYNKYGKDNFVFEIISYVEDRTKLIEYEQKWLDFLKPEYNICKIAGSRLGIKHTDETKAKIGKAGKGRITSDETKVKIGKAGKGRITSDETKLKMSESHKDVKKSDKAKANISKAKKGSIPWNKGIKAKKLWQSVPSITDKQF